MLSIRRGSLLLVALLSLVWVALPARAAKIAPLKPNPLAEGLQVALECKNPYNISYDTSKVAFDFVVKPETRRVREITVSYHLYDMYKTLLAEGRFTQTLYDCVEARKTITITPPRFGWYTLSCDVSSRGQHLTGVAAFLGVTPQYAGMPVLAEGESQGGWNDIPRTAFTGLKIHRTNTNLSFEQLDELVRQSRLYGVRLLVQFENINTVKPDHVRAYVTHFKGLVKYWEVMNEPNFTYKTPAEYVAMLQEVSGIIKEIDPQAQVVGPDVCGVNLDWYQKFYEAGGGKYVDILSVHDYEGHESIDPWHWLWKFGKLREIMTQHGDGNKQIWQTERAVGGLRAQEYLGGAQAVRITMRYDVCEALGIPNEQNIHYYLNEGGYHDVPTYIWSASGPHPAALAMRTRTALTQNKKFTGTLDFGPTGNKIYFGLRFSGDTGSTILLRNHGTLDQTLELGLTSGKSVTLMDSFGNAKTLRPRRGKITVAVPALPVYLLLEKGQDIVVPKIDFGNNLAAHATFTFTGASASDPATLVNGIFETQHPDNPYKTFWAGKLGDATPSLEIDLGAPRPVSKMIIYSVRADNPFCTLLDYDLQYWNGQKWVTIDKVRTPCPPSDLVTSSDSVVNTWYNDENFFVHEFDPITTSKLRIVALRTTYGFMVDKLAVAATGWPANEQTLMLREVEIYAPKPEVELTAAMVNTVKSETTGREPLALLVKNSGKTAFSGKVRVTVPEGWGLYPATLAVKVAAGEMQSLKTELLPPENLPVGYVPVTITLYDTLNQPVDSYYASLTVAPPVRIEPQLPATLNGAEQPVSVRVSNLTDQPVSGTLTMTAVGTGTGVRGPLELAFGPIEPRKAAVVTYTVPLMKLGEKMAWQLNYTATVNHLMLSVEQEVPAMRPWQAAGPFPNEQGEGFDAIYAPEQGVDLRKSVEMPDGATTNWKLTPNNPDGLVNLSAFFRPNENVCAYAVVYVLSPSDRAATLSAGSDDGIKTWLNGKLVISNNAARGAAPGQEKVAVNLKSGWNEVLVKITQGVGGWGFYSDFLDANGAPMSDLVYSGSKD